MRSVNRRWVLRSTLAIAGGLTLRRLAAARTPRVIEIVARRFVYEPNVIALKVDEPVALAVRSIDFVHGMNIPDLDLRADLVPGKITRLEFTPRAPGVIDFLCDNFCGDGHEEMHGRFVVSA